MTAHTTKTIKDELSWWMDHTGATHTQCKPPDTRLVLASGMIYPSTRAGVIAQLNNRPANLSMISRELLDALHKRFPGTRWWIKDPAPAGAPQRQTAS